MSLRRVLPAAAVVLALLLPAAARAAEPSRLLEGFSRGQAVIETRTACHLLDVYLALSPEQRAQGLMYIRELGEFEGMLFLAQQPALLSMWMKNTYIPLDMLFIGANGKIAMIAAGTTPLSTETIRSKEPVTGVLELNGGFAARHDVVPGDRFELVP